MDMEIKVGSLVMAHDLGSWVDEKPFTVYAMDVTSSDGIRGLGLQAVKDDHYHHRSCRTVLPREQCEPLPTDWDGIYSKME